MSSAGNGIFTSVLDLLERIGLIRRLSENEKVYRETARERDAFADIMRYPHIWLVCPFCGAQSYRLPPHAQNPCPVAESQGLKLDAERNAAVRMGQQMEEATRFIREQKGDGDDGEE
jgi:hypothetical protein